MPTSTASPHVLPELERVLDLLQGASDLIQVLRPDGRFRYTNATWQAALDYSPAESEQLSGFELVHSAHRDRFRQAFQDALVGVAIAPMRTVLLAKTGQPLFVEGRLGCWTNAAGESEVWTLWRQIPTCLDSEETDQHSPSPHKALSEDALNAPSVSTLAVAQLAQRDVELLAIAVENAGDAIEITDADIVIEYVNPACEQITGYSRAETIGKTPAQLFRSGLHDEAFYQAIVDTLKAGQVWRGTIVGRRKDGSLCHQAATISPVLDDAGELANTVAVKRDITQQKQAEDALKQLNEALEAKVVERTAALQASEKRFRTIFEQAAVGIAEVSLSGQLLEVNQCFCEFLGYTEAELLGMTVRDITPPADVEVVAHFKQKLVTGEVGSVSIEKRYIHKNGAILWANLTLSLLRDADGSPLCDIAVIQDISDRRAALRDRQQAEANLQIKQIQLEALLNNIPHIAWLKDRESRFIAVNEAFGLAVGWSPEALVGQTDSEIASDLTAQQYRHEDLTVMRQGHRRIVEEEMVTVAGERRWMETIRTPIRDEGGEITGTVGIAVDITDRKQTEVRLREREAAVRQREATTRAILQAIPDLLLHHDSNGICVDVIPGETVKLIGEPNHLVGCSAYDYLPPDLANQRMHYVRLAQATGEVQLYEQELERGGEVHYEEVRLVPGHNQDVLAIVRDISDRKRAEAELERYRLQLEDMVAARTAALEREIAERKRIEQQLFQEKELAQVTLHSIGDAVIATDALGCVEYLNPVAERLTGWDAAAARGRSLATIFEVIDEATREPIDNPVAPILRHDRPQAIDSQSVLVARNGIPYSIDSSAAPIHNREGDTIGAVLVFRDVTRSRMLARQLSWQASHDALTRLTNRRHFEQVLSEVVQGTKLDRQQHTFCFLDLDRFKVVNDTCGHLAGDELLRQVSALLKTRVRATDTLARLGGDEFGILLQQCPLTQAETIAEWMRKAIHGFRFVWENRAFTIGVSIGLVPLNGDSHSLASILSAADAACYAAKERGRNRIHVYQPDDLELARQRSERQWSVRIRQALEDNRFCLYRQAIVPTLTHPSLGDSEMRDSSTGDSPWPVEDRGQQYELLLRMVDSNGHIIQPSAFIPAAERYDLMPEIDRWVVRTFLNFCQLYPEQIPCSDPDTPSLLYTINLSGASISDDRWLQWLKEELQQYPAFARATCFEITETAAITSLNRATRSVWDLKQLGCRFALDDFGTGMSSFAYLKHLPVDYLKIDGRFIEDMESDLTARAIVESINHIGHVMGLKTIAEYVGNAAIRQLLGDMGVDYVQGYGIAVPSPIVWPQSPYRLSS